MNERSCNYVVSQYSVVGSYAISERSRREIIGSIALRIARHARCVLEIYSGASPKRRTEARICLLRGMQSELKYRSIYASAKRAAVELRACVRAHEAEAFASILSPLRVISAEAMPSTASK